MCEQAAHRTVREKGHVTLKQDVQMAGLELRSCSHLSSVRLASSGPSGGGLL